MEIKKVAVIGAGTMGAGIAQTFAQSGFTVILQDVKDEYVRSALAGIRQRLEKRAADKKMESDEKDRILERIRVTSRLDDCAVADLVVEAVIEREEMKAQIFRGLDPSCRPETIFATNTSSISVTRLAGDTNRRDRFVGMHFMNPAYSMKLVEIIRGPFTSEETVDTVSRVAGAMGKTAVEVEDSPGFVSNRVLMPMINEAIYCLQEGVAPKEGIDAVMKLGANQPMGPLELADFIGLDTCLAILGVLNTELGEKFRPCPLLRRMVAAGKLGRKSGEGFYEYR